MIKNYGALALALAVKWSHALVVGLACVGFTVVTLAATAWLLRDEIFAWYRQLPVALFAKCPGAKK